MADFTEFINRLSEKTGLHTDVVRAWVSREQGVNNNVLGLTSASAKTPSNTHGLLRFSSQTAGADATAAMILGSANYAGIRASLGGSSQDQAIAISKSPWRLGPTGVKNAGGFDAYYLAGFVKAGILSTSDKPSGGASTPITPSPNGPLDIVGDAVGSLNPIGGLDLNAPFFFIGIILIATVLVLVGGLVTLKGKTPEVMPIPV